MARKVRNPGVGRGAGQRIKTERECSCGAKFLASRSDAVYCKPCGNRRKSRALEHRQARLCLDCGMEVTRKSVRCNSCNGKDRVGKINRERNPNWRGGETIHRAGYRFILDPRPNPKHRYVAEHRFFWEQANGPIPDRCIIHHLNGNKQDNRLENLTVLSNSAHRKLHADVDLERSRYIQSLEARIRSLEEQPIPARHPG